MDGHVDRVGVVGRVEGELLLQVEHLAVETHLEGLKFFKGKV